MSLLDSGPHIVTVYPQEETVDSYGNTIKRPSSVGVQIRCRLEVISDARDPGSDQRLGGAEAYRMSCRSAPIGPWSRIEWQGKIMTVKSGPFFHDQSAATARVVCTLIVQR